MSEILRSSIPIDFTLATLTDSGMLTWPTMRQNHGMQRSGGGAFFGEINVNSRHPLIPNVIRLKFIGVTRC